MRITGFGNIKPSETKKKKKTDSDTSSASDFASMITGSEDKSPTSGSSAVNVSQAILGVQEVDWEQQSKKEHMQRGNKLLELLEAIRNGLLIGRISPQDLRTLQTTLEQRKEEVKDPELAAIVQEIEVRAAVELAKIEKFHY